MFVKFLCSGSIYDSWFSRNCFIIHYFINYYFIIHSFFFLLFIAVLSPIGDKGKRTDVTISTGFNSTLCYLIILTYHSSVFLFIYISLFLFLIITSPITVLSFYIWQKVKIIVWSFFKVNILPFFLYSCVID